jgi:hypothetical protein
MVTITAPTCIVCGEAARIVVTDDEAERIRTARFIQEALPAWAPAERELLISGTHPACWDSLFAEEG